MKLYFGICCLVAKKLLSPASTFSCCSYSYHCLFWKQVSSCYPRYRGESILTLRVLHAMQRRHVGCTHWTTRLVVWWTIALEESWSLVSTLLPTCPSETLQIQSYGDDFLQAAPFQQTSGLREVSDHLLSNNGSSPKQRLCQLSGVLKIAWYLLKVCLDIKVPLWLGNRVLPCSLSPKLLQMCPWRDFCMHYYLKTPRVSDPFA